MQNSEPEALSAHLTMLPVLSWAVLIQTFASTGMGIRRGKDNNWSDWSEILCDFLFGICAFCALRLFGSILRRIRTPQIVPEPRTGASLPYLIPFGGLAGFIVLMDVAGVHIGERPPQYMLYSLPRACVLAVAALTCDQIAKHLKVTDERRSLKEVNPFFLTTAIAAVLFVLSMAAMAWFVISYFDWDDEPIYALTYFLSSLCVLPILCLAYRWDRFARSFPAHSGAHVRRGFQHIFTGIGLILLVIFCGDVWDWLSGRARSDTFFADRAYFLAILIFCVGWSRAARSLYFSHAATIPAPLETGEMVAKWTSVILVLATLIAIGIALNGSIAVTGRIWPQFHAVTMASWILWLGLASVTIDLVATSQALKTAVIS